MQGERQCRERVYKIIAAQNGRTEVSFILGDAFQFQCSHFKVQKRENGDYYMSEESHQFPLLLVSSFSLSYSFSLSQNFEKKGKGNEKGKRKKESQDFEKKGNLKRTKIQKTKAKIKVMNHK